jgi:hypothetical protein
MSSDLGRAADPPGKGLAGYGKREVNAMADDIGAEPDVITAR